MFELIGAILYGLAMVAWWLIKMAWKIGKYILPLGFIILGIFLGGSWANGCYGSLGDDYLSDTKQQLTHEVTIYWDDYETDYDVIKVREDLNWCINTQSTYLSTHDFFDDEDFMELFWRLIAYVETFDNGIGTFYRRLEETMNEGF